MQRFSRIIQDAASPGPHADRFPASPRRLKTKKEAGQWRVQCLLMNAEVRYSLYLRLLEDWLVENKGYTPEHDSWPLPPW